MASLRTRLLLLAAALLLGLPAAAQLHRGARTLVRSGLMPKPDSLRAERDSLRLAGLLLEMDSVAAPDYAADSAAVAALRTDDRRTLDSLAAARYAAALQGLDTTAKRPRLKKGWFMSDSMSLSKVCWLSTVLPGYGQVYNRQYWKLPVLYGTVGAGLALFLHENKTYKPLKRAYESYTNTSLARTPELDALQTKMIRSNTRRQIYLGITIASYVYFIGDAAVNYSTNEVSSVKKATTLACIFPGAGQIYNKSYWKVPFVVGGFASMIYIIDWNTRGYQRFKKAYRLRYDYDQKVAAHNQWKEDVKNDPDLPEPENPASSTDEFKGRYSADFLKNLKNNYRRNRDLSIIATAGLYILQIVDAHVDAHLKDFDVSDDLSMRIEPAVDYAFIAGTGVRPVVGFNFSINF